MRSIEDILYPFLKIYNALPLYLRNKMRTSAKKNTTEKERGLIEALSKRYVKEAVEDRSPLDLAYANAMKELYAKYPNDADVGVLYAESLMNLHPWDLQDKKGKNKAWTPEIISILENIIANKICHYLLKLCQCLSQDLCHLLP